MKRFIAGLLCLMLLTACGSETSHSSLTTSVTASAGVGLGVKVVGRVAGAAVAVDVDDVVAKPAGKPEALATHVITFTNTTERTLTVNRQSTWKSDSAKDGQVIVATENCGYSSDGPGGAVKAGTCNAIGSVPSPLEPHATLTVPITLYSGLTGMPALTDGSFNWSTTLTYLDGDDSGAATATVEYSVTL